MDPHELPMGSWLTTAIPMKEATATVSHRATQHGAATAELPAPDLVLLRADQPPRLLPELHM
jgi:hypothetical protein